MLDFFKRKQKQEVKNYAPASATHYFLNNSYNDPTISFELLAKGGYQRNPIAYRCIELISSCVASIDVYLYDVDSEGNRIEIENHPIIKLLSNPNITQTKTKFIKELVANQLIGGSGFVFNPNIDAVPNFLYNLQPSDVKIISGNAVPQAYEFGNRQKYPVDQLTGKSAVLQLKNYSPTNYWYGQSPLEACIYAIDAFNNALKWNNSLLNVGCKPDGIITPKGDANYTQDQFLELVKSIKDNWEGSNNSGGVKVLNGFEWQQMSLTPKDMDFKESQIMAARYIANCFGVPSQMLNIPDSQTFSNYEMANLSFWQETVIPIAKDLYSSLGKWLNLFFKTEYQLMIDEDNISALNYNKTLLSERMRVEVQAGIRTINEARFALGLEEKEGADDLLVSGSQMPLSAVVDTEISDEEQTQEVNNLRNEQE